MNPVFLHGWGTHPLIWEPLLEHFPAARALPLPGYADSVPATTLDAMAAALAGQMATRSHIVGWSLGGLIAARIALDFPEKVASLTLVAATPCFVKREDWPHGIAAEVFDQFAENLAQDYAGTIRRFLSLQAQGSADMREVLSLLRRKLLDQPKPAKGVLEAGLGILQNVDLREGMSKLSIPVSLVHGTGDKLAPVSAARWLADAVPHASLHEIAGAGHAPFLSHPQVVADIVSESIHD